MRCESHQVESVQQLQILAYERWGQVDTQPYNADESSLKTELYYIYYYSVFQKKDTWEPPRLRETPFTNSPGALGELDVHLLYFHELSVVIWDIYGYPLGCDWSV